MHDETFGLPFTDGEEEGYQVRGEREFANHELIGVSIIRQRSGSPVFGITVSEFDGLTSLNALIDALTEARDTCVKDVERIYGGLAVGEFAHPFMEAWPDEARCDFVWPGGEGHTCCRPPHRDPHHACLDEGGVVTHVEHGSAE